MMKRGTSVAMNLRGGITIPKKPELTASKLRIIRIDCQYAGTMCIKMNKVLTHIHPEWKNPIEPVEVTSREDAMEALALASMLLLEAGKYFNKIKPDGTPTDIVGAPVEESKGWTAREDMNPPESL